MPEHTIAENLTRLQNAKTAIGNAITAKGGTVAASDGLEEFAADIATIPSGGDYNAKFVSVIAFTPQETLTDIIIPDGVTVIAETCFKGYYNLKRVSFPNTLTAIYAQGFMSTGLINIELNNGITSIGTNAFFNCQRLTSITIPSSITSIASCFTNCFSLTTITIDKPEGSISGAPWGAPNATVVWTG